jgi:hypothetical protein
MARHELEVSAVQRSRQSAVNSRGMIARYKAVVTSRLGAGNRLTLLIIKLVAKIFLLFTKQLFCKLFKEE